MSEDADYEKYEMAEYNAFRNMIKQYMPSFAVSLVSDGFNIWNAVTRLWPSELVPADGGDSMRALLAKRLESLQLSLIRPDSGEGVETLPQLLTVLNTALKEHFQEDLAPLVPIFPADDPYAAKYDALLAKIRAKLGLDGEANPFRRFKGQQMRILQGDGVALDTVGDMLASLLANGFCANCVHFGSGGETTQICRAVSAKSPSRLATNQPTDQGVEAGHQSRACLLKMPEKSKNFKKTRQNRQRTHERKNSCMHTAGFLSDSTCSDVFQLSSSATVSAPTSPCVVGEGSHCFFV